MNTFWIRKNDLCCSSASFRTEGRLVTAHGQGFGFVIFSSFLSIIVPQKQTHKHTRNIMNSENLSSGLKRSMPCTDLISMGSRDEMDDLTTTRCEPKRRRTSPMDAKRKLLASSPSQSPNPATEALDAFLRMAVDDLVPTFDLAESDQLFTSKHHLCSFDAPLKSIPTIHELTRGMARVSASS